MDCCPLGKSVDGLRILRACLYTQLATCALTIFRVVQQMHEHALQSCEANGRSVATKEHDTTSVADLAAKLAD